MPFPTTPHLQATVLDMLVNGEKSGKHIREELKNKHRQNKSLPAFYQLMDRMHKGGLVKPRSVTIEVKGYLVKERRYTITAKGRRSLNENIMHYLGFANSLAQAN